MTGKSILLIDPFENVLKVYQTLLKDKGFEVDAANNIADSLDCFGKKQHPIIIIEYFISLEEIIHFLEMVKKSSPETYVILSTSMCIDDRTYKILFDKGLDDFLLKPYAPEKLLIHIQKGLKQIELTVKQQEMERNSFFEPIAQQGQQEIFKPPFFMKELRRELKKSRRHQHSMSLLLLKIPPREIMGERYETFYIELVKILKNSLREEDIVGRENGKVGIILPQTDQVGSQTLEQRLLSKIQSCPSFKTDQFLEPITNSLSFQSYSYPGLSNPPEFLKSMLESIDTKSIPN